MSLQSPYLFFDPTDGWAPVSNGAGHAYDVDTDGVHRPFVELETSGSGALYSVVGGTLSAKPPGYEGMPATQDLLNREETGSGSQRWSDAHQTGAMRTDPLVGQPLPETVRLYLHPTRPVAMAEQSMSVAGMWAVPTALAFGYVDVDPATIAPALGTHLDGAEFIAENAELRGQLNGASADEKVEMLVAGLLDVHVPTGVAIGQAAETAPGSGTRRGGFTVFEANGPSDPALFYRLLGNRATVPNDQSANAGAELDALVGPTAWPLYDVSSENAALGDTETQTFPFPVLEALRDQFDLSPAQWRTVGDNQKALYRARLLERTGHGDGTAPPFEFEVLDLKNVFQLEAVAEFYVNYPEPYATGTTPRDPDGNLAGSDATVDESYAPGDAHVAAAFERISLGQGLDLSVLTPNLDHLVLWDDTERPSRTYRIVGVDNAAQTLLVEGKPSLDGGVSDWELQGYKTVDLLDPAGTAARTDAVTPSSGEAVVHLDDADPDVLRWLWLRSEGRDKDETNQPDTMTDTVHLDGVGLFEITGVAPADRALTVEGTPSISGTTAWTINRRPSVVLVDPMGHRLSGRRTAMPSASSSSTVELQGPTPDLGRVNPNFDTVHFPDGTGDRTYRIADVDESAGTVTLHEQPSLPSEGSRWGINSGVGGVLPPLYYVLGNDGNGYNHYDAMLFVVGGGEVRRAFRWTSYTSRNYAPGHQWKSSSRGNMRYQYESWGSGSEFQNLNIVVSDCLSKYYDYPAHWQRLHADGNREAAWYFEDSPPSDPLSADPAAPVSADRTPREQPGAKEDGKTEVRFHWSPHYRGRRGARSAGCLTSPSYPSLRRTLAEYYQEEHEALTGSQNADMQAIIDSLPNQETAENSYRAHLDDWKFSMVGDVWLVRPEQRPTEEGY